MLTIEDTEHPSPRESRDKDHWSLDRKVPLALILALIIQTVTIVWWAAGITASSNEMHRRVEVLEQQQNAVKIGERLAVLESQMGMTNSTLMRLEVWLRDADARDKTGAQK